MASPVLAGIVSEEMQNGVSESSSFVLCDANAHGFPIRYASKGFEELFGHAQKQCIGQTCGGLVGGAKVLEAAAIDSTDGPLAAAAAAAGMSIDDAKTGINTITEAVGIEMRQARGNAVRQQMAARNNNPTVAADATKPASGYGVMVNQRKDGSLFTCELVTRIRQHPGMGWSYCIGLQMDISNEVPVQDLLTIVANGKYSELLGSRQPASKSLLASLESEDSSRYLDDTAGVMWQSMLKGPDTGKGPDDDGLKKAKAKANKQTDACSMASRSTAASSRSGYSVVSVESATSVTKYECGQQVSAAEVGCSGLDVFGHSMQSLTEVAALSDVANNTRRVSFEDVQELQRLEEERQSQCDQGRFMDLLEDVDPSTDSDTESFVRARLGWQEYQRSLPGMNLLSMESFDPELFKVITEFWRKEIYDLDIALTLSDPSFPDCPIIGCSAGFETLTGYSVPEVVGKNACELMLHDVPDTEKNTKAKDAQRIQHSAGMAGKYCAASVALSTEGVACDDSCPLLRSLTHGEVLCAQDSRKKGGDALETMMFYKQVMLDEKSFVVGLHIPMLENEMDSDYGGSAIGTVFDEKTLAEASAETLSEYVDVAQQVLASLFWYSSPMRRQIACDAADVDDDFQ